MESVRKDELRVAEFCKEVQKYDCLYNKFNKDYIVKINCWRPIADKFGISPEYAAKKFENTRTACGRYLKKMKNMLSGSGRDGVPPREFTNLEWLQPHITSRATLSKFAKIDDESAGSACGSVELDEHEELDALDYSRESLNDQET